MKPFSDDSVLFMSLLEVEGTVEFAGFVVEVFLLPFPFGVVWVDSGGIWYGVIPWLEFWELPSGVGWGVWRGTWYGGIPWERSKISSLLSSE